MSTKRPQPAPADGVRPDPSPPPPPKKAVRFESVVEVTLDKESRAAMDRLSAALEVMDHAERPSPDSRPKTVTIEVPCGEEPDGGAVLCDRVACFLSCGQAGTLDRLLRGLRRRCATYSDDGVRLLPVESEADALRWLLEEIRDAVREST